MSHMAALEPEEVRSCLASCACEPVHLPAGYLATRAQRAKMARRPQLLHLRSARTKLLELDALACCSRWCHAACWSAPLALATAADGLHAACRLGFARGVAVGLSLQDPATLFVARKCDRYGIGDIDVRGTLFHAAVLSDSSEMLAAIIERFAQHIDLPDTHGQTPLYLASICRRKRSDAIGMLLAARADPDACSGRAGAARAVCTDLFNPHTALVMACRRRDLDCVEMLLKYSADVNNYESEGCEGLSPVRVAVLHDRTYEPTRPTIEDVQARARLLRRLLAARADVDGLAPEDRGEGRTALTIAVRDDPSAVLAAELLKAGAALEIRDAFGDTPLHVASTFGHLRCVRLLLEARADPEARDSDGKPPRTVAFSWSRHPSQEDRSVMEMLLHSCR